MIPDNVEKIIMTKEDYDRNVEQLLLEKINAEQEIERLNNKNEELLTLYTTEREVKDYYKNIINELEEELERESNMKEEDTCLEHNTFIDVRNTLKTVLKRLQELKGSE